MITLPAAFVGGLVSFFSPCILPIIPGYLSFLTTVNSGQKQANRFALFKTSLFFVIGFGFTFVFLGLAAGLLGSYFRDFQVWLARTGGLLIILFGLFTLGLVKIPFFQSEHSLGIKPKKGYFSAVVVGASFAVAWTPCVSAILGSILILATLSSSVGSAGGLLVAYALGLGIPFLLTGIFADSAKKLLPQLGKKLLYLNWLAGILLIGLGILVFTNKLALFINLFS